MTIFGDLERFLADLYPYRWPLTAALGAAVLAGLYVAVQRGWHLAAWRRRWITGGVAAVALAVGIPAGDYLLSPLWERSYLEEASPLAAVSDGPAAPSAATSAAMAATAPPAMMIAAPSTPAAPVPSTSAAPAAGGTAFTPGVRLQGTFQGADDFHFGRGSALIIETAPGMYTLRFEEFSVRNGPDLYVYLSPDPEGYASGARRVGQLKATDGAFNYDLPADVDLAAAASVVIWCEPFAVLFAWAPLAAA